MFDALPILGPEGRANAICSTLTQIAALPGALTPGVKGALHTAFFVLAIPHEGDTPPITARRVTCADIADGLVAIGFPRTAGDGRAAAPWFQAQIDAWSGSDDPRQRAMADTARRELNELLD